MEVWQLCWCGASSPLRPISMGSDRKEWLETSWGKYWDNSVSELKEPCFREETTEEDQVKTCVQCSFLDKIKLSCLNSVILSETMTWLKHQLLWWGLHLHVPHPTHSKEEVLPCWLAPGTSSWSSWEQGSRLPVAPWSMCWGSYSSHLHVLTVTVRSRGTRHPERINTLEELVKENVSNDFRPDEWDECLFLLILSLCVDRAMMWSISCSDTWGNTGVRSERSETPVS